MDSTHGDLEADGPSTPRLRNSTNPHTNTAQDPQQASPSSTSLATPTKTRLSKLPKTSTPKSRKRKARTSGYADDSDSDYRARTPSSRKSSRRSTLETDPDGDYGGSMTPTRTMTRTIQPRFPRKSTVYNSSEDEGEEEVEDEREGLCLETCRYYETDEMLECDGIDCGRRRFHLRCVGFRSMPVLGRGKWWFCFECRKVEGKGLRANGVFVEGEEDGDGEGE